MADHDVCGRDQSHALAAVREHAARQSDVIADLVMRVDELAREAGRREGEAEMLRRQLTLAQANNHQRNLQLDALHFVWCSGGCSRGVHRFTGGELTEELVAEAERNTKRMRERLTNRLARARRAQG